jgi:glycosyltransferase involved in cell wall biosynthesis
MKSLSQSFSQAMPLRKQQQAPCSDAAGRDSVSPAHTLDEQAAPVRMAYLISQYPAVSHTFILREVRRLRTLGYEVHVVSINPADRPRSAMTNEEQEEAALTYVVKQTSLAVMLSAHVAALCRRPRGYGRGLWTALRLGGLDLRKWLFHLLYFVEAVLLGQWMARKRLTHVHVHFATPAATVALLAAKIFPVTFSLTVHGPDEFFDAPGYRLAEKITAASFVCCIGSYARSQLMSLVPPTLWAKLVVSPLGVDPSVFVPRPFRSHPDPFEILCVGRLTPVKGQAVLLAACEQLVQAGRQMRLRLVGAGPDRERLEAETVARGLQPYVEFAGAVNQEQIQAFYRCADLFVLPSFAEGIPVVLMEALAMEIPCVTTWITGIPELIRPGQEGLLVVPGDERALTEAIVQLMDDPTLRLRLGRAGRQRVMEQYDLQRNTARLAEIFRQRVGSAG